MLGTKYACRRDSARVPIITRDRLPRQAPDFALVLMARASDGSVRFLVYGFLFVVSSINVPKKCRIVRQAKVAEGAKQNLCSVCCYLYTNISE